MQHISTLYARYICLRAHSAKRARDDRVYCIQRIAKQNLLLELEANYAQKLLQKRYIVHTHITIKYSTDGDIVYIEVYIVVYFSTTLSGYMGQL